MTTLFSRICQWVWVRTGSILCLGVQYLPLSIIFKETNSQPHNNVLNVQYSHIPPDSLIFETHSISEEPLLPRHLTQNNGIASFQKNVLNVKWLCSVNNMVKISVFLDVLFTPLKIKYFWNLTQILIFFKSYTIDLIVASFLSKLVNANTQSFMPYVQYNQRFCHYIFGQCTEEIFKQNIKELFFLSMCLSSQCLSGS